MIESRVLETANCPFYRLSAEFFPVRKTAEKFSTVDEQIGHHPQSVSKKIPFVCSRVFDNSIRHSSCAPLRSVYFNMTKFKYNTVPDASK